MSSRLTVLSLMRNEEGRFLRSVLRAWMEFADDVLILDDGSTDRTADLARSEGAEVVEMAETDPAWGNEWPKRSRLFTAGIERLDEGDYAMILDADMVPLRSPRPLLEVEPDAVAFNLYDLWSTDPPTFREDEYWRGHLVPRVWLFRKPREPEGGWEWNERGLHSGHLPQNFRAYHLMIAPPDYGLLHYAYSEPALRVEKFAAYMREVDQLSPEEIAHAQSIVDPEPRLRRLPFEPDYPVQIERENAPSLSR